MKAIHYKGQNKFYLFDKPEIPKLNDKDNTWYKETGGYLDPTVWYDRKLEANLSAGKEIINPEVLEIGNLLSPFTAWFNKAKPGDIFDLPDNIGFEEDWKDHCTVGCEKKTQCLYHCEKGYYAIRLFVKEEVKPESVNKMDFKTQIETDQPLIEIQKKEIDRLKSELEIQLRNGQAVKRMVHKAITERDSLKSELDKAVKLLRCAQVYPVDWDIFCEIENFLKDKR